MIGWLSGEPVASQVADLGLRMSRVERMLGPLSELAAALADVADEPDDPYDVAAARSNRSYLQLVRPREAQP